MQVNDLEIRKANKIISMELNLDLKPWSQTLEKDRFIVIVRLREHKFRPDEVSQDQKQPWDIEAGPQGQDRAEVKPGK